MQDRYTGDVGDFGKYGLLRHFCGNSSELPELKLGIVWYLVPDESHNDDGKHTRYLEKSAKNDRMFRVCDPVLYESLSGMDLNADRCVATIRNAAIFSPETVFFERPLTFDGIPSIGSASRRARLAHRSAWVQEALEETASCDIVFVDPDNGLEVKTRSHERRGPKYAYFDELAPYTARGQSLIIYHHIGRNGTAEEQVMARLSEIARRLERGLEAFALHYHRGTARVFFVVPARDQQDLLLEKSAQLASGVWQDHFDLIRP